MPDTPETAGPPRLLRYHHVTLPFREGDEDSLRAYYVDVLGLQEVTRPASIPGRGLWFRSGQVDVHLSVEEEPRAHRRAHPGLLVEGLDALARRLEDAGWRADRDDGFPGHRRFFSWDPFGNRLEFLEPVA